ncbi:MAG: hypothetical protein JWN01_1293 [Patescibacteria group bacterium]|nr:hypothetical protein [Patescibacteria group bacterium]
MDKFKKFMSHAKRQRKNDVRLVASAPRQFSDADREKFAQAVVRDYGETLVLLSKE